MRQVCVYAQAGAPGLSAGGVELARCVFDDVWRGARLSGGGFAYSVTVDRGIADPIRSSQLEMSVVFETHFKEHLAE
jgi:hypothetical protein